MRREIGLRNRPAAALDAWPLEKIDVVELEDLAAPPVGAAAGGTKAPDVNAIVLQPGNFALVGILRGLFDVAATTFQQKDGLAEAGEFDREQDACRSGSDDADIGVL